MAKPIQEQFGQTIIDAVDTFARKDIPTVDDFTNTTFAHIHSPAFRRKIAETFYGARWIYKLGLALLVKDVERSAHIRAQILDYGAVCEGVLSDALMYAIAGGHMNGNQYMYSVIGSTRHNHRINWNVQNKLRSLQERTFQWLIVVAQEEGIIDAALAGDLDKLRDARNGIHLGKSTPKAYLETSQKYYKVVLDSCSATRLWKAAHP